MEGKTKVEKIVENLESLRRIVPDGIQVLAVSKFQPIESLRAAYEAGQRLFGESRTAELLEKIPLMPEDTKWHFIGHLQTNKVKSIIGKITLIESVDSLKLLDLIDAESRKKEVLTGVLLQVHVAAEETKFGFSPAEITEYFESRKFESLTNTHIYGLMAMASNVDDEARIRADFATVADLMRRIKEEMSPDLRNFNILSMGMSGDWPIAIEEGANIIRIGTGIFGSR